MCMQFGKILFHQNIFFHSQDNKTNVKVYVRELISFHRMSALQQQLNNSTPDPVDRTYYNHSLNK